MTFSELSILDPVENIMSDIKIILSNTDVTIQEKGLQFVL